MDDFTIDPEFRSLIRPLTSVERADLERSIDKYGCFDPFIVWTEQGILLDGHHRRELCLDLERTWDVKYVSLPSRDAAKAWIESHAVSRRNLTEAEASLIRGRQYNAAKQAKGGDRKSIPQSEGLISTAEKLAEEHGVSKATIERDGKLAEAVEAVKAIDPDIEEKVATGVVTKSDANESAAHLARGDEEAAREVLQPRLVQPARQAPTKDKPTWDPTEKWNLFQSRVNPIVEGCPERHLKWLADRIRKLAAYVEGMRR